MRVIGSHAMSTMLPLSGLTGSRVAAMAQLLHLGS